MNCKKVRSILIKYSTMLVLVFAAGCNLSTSGKVVQNISGPLNQQIEFDRYSEIIYVRQIEGSSEIGSGSKDDPYTSISAALTSIEKSDSSQMSAILVSEGIYSGTYQLKEYVHLFGGFSAPDWQRDIYRHKSILNGGKENRVVIGADDSVIDGFVITNGQIRGKGGAFICDAVSPQITNNIFINNKTLKPIPWNPKFWHDTANDGGAIFCGNKANPLIKNNLFFRNRTENGRGGAIAVDNRCRPDIINNVFLDNQSGLDDPMRSSDGGALSIFDWCNVRIEDNYFIGNKSLSKNDGGAVFIALWSSAHLKNNVFVENEAGDDAGALFVGGQEHRYDSPLDPLPPAEQFFVKIDGNLFVGNQNPSKNSGAMRFTMESRGSFTNNTVAHNTGIYFQRSEVLIENNTILNNYLHVETKEGLKSCIIRNNLLWGDFDLQIEAVVENNNMRDLYEGAGNISRKPKFREEVQNLYAYSVSYSRSKLTSDVFLSGSNLVPGALLGRVVKAGDHWTVVRQNSADILTVYGDHSGKIEFIILPVYHQVN
jgi:hypothetical protein